ncbi:MULTISPECIES: hypothetical protein [unclassified Bartonella]
MKPHSEEQNAQLSQDQQFLKAIKSPNSPVEKRKVAKREKA